jgi:hypothetical protein
MAIPDEFAADQIRAALMFTCRAAEAQFSLAYDPVIGSHFDKSGSTARTRARTPVEDLADRASEPASTSPSSRRSNTPSRSASPRLSPRFVTIR